MNNHTTSLKLSKRLKKAGVEQESEFYWWGSNPSGQVSRAENVHPNLRIASAFLASELLEMLPWEIENDGIKYNLRIWKGWTGRMYIQYKYPQQNENPKPLIGIISWNKSLPEAAGEMLLWVIEQDYE